MRMKTAILRMQKTEYWCIFIAVALIQTLLSYHGAEELPDGFTFSKTILET